MWDFITSNIGTILAIVMFAEKSVLVSKSKHNDIIVSGLKIFGKILKGRIKK